MSEELVWSLNYGQGCSVPNRAGAKDKNQFLTNISEHSENNLAGFRSMYKESDFAKTCAHIWLDTLEQLSWLLIWVNLIYLI